MKSPTSLGPLMIDIEGIELTDVDKDILSHPLVGGVILFSRNYESVEQVTDLCRNLHDLRDEPLLISVDHEGGRVQRFRNEFTKIPCMQTLGQLYESDQANAHQTAEIIAWLMAAELRDVGVDFTFAPVLDINYGCSEVIGDRAFSSDKNSLAQLATSFQKGLKSAGMASIGKHFPGHGAVAPDSHVALPVDERTLDVIMAEDVYPFRKLIEEGMNGIMPAHVIYQQVDELPAGFSRYWLQTVLRSELGFNGTIFSDDITMHGASVIGGFVDRAQYALQAGCDMVLICNDRQASETVIDALDMKGVLSDESSKRLSAMRATVQTKGMARQSEKWRLAQQVIERVS